MTHSRWLYRTPGGFYMELELARWLDMLGGARALDSLQCLKNEWQRANPKTRAGVLNLLRCLKKEEWRFQRLRCSGKQDRSVHAMFQEQGDMWHRQRDKCHHQPAWRGHVPRSLLVQFLHLDDKPDAIKYPCPRTILRSLELHRPIVIDLFWFSFCYA